MLKPSQLVKRLADGSKQIDISFRSTKDGYFFMVVNQEEPELSEWHEREEEELVTILKGLLREIEI